jgi:hypothetical protein
MYTIVWFLKTLSQSKYLCDQISPIHNFTSKSDKYVQVDETQKWWNWTENVLLQQLRAQNWYNGKPPIGLTGFLNDRANRIMGYGIIRQIRAKPDTCR